MKSCTNIYNSLLQAPADGTASFTLDVTKPLDIAVGQLVRLVASIRVGNVDMPTPLTGFLVLRRQDPGSRLQMIMDDKTLYDKEVKNTGGKFEQIESEKTQVTENPKVKIVQDSGAQPMDITIRGLGLAKAESVRVSAENTQAGSATGGQQTGGQQTGQQTVAPSRAVESGPASQSGGVNSVASLESGTNPATGLPAQTTAGQQPPKTSGPASQASSGPGSQATSGPGSKATSGRGSSTSLGPGSQATSGFSSSTSSSSGTSPPTSSGPATIVPNEGAYGRPVNKAVAYMVPLVAAFLL